MSKCQDPEEIKKLHPRFVELKKIHGIEYEKAATGATGPQKLSSSLISITLKCVAASIGEKVPLTKKLPATTTVGKLKILCESFFKIKSVKPKLFIQEEEIDATLEELSNSPAAANIQKELSSEEMEIEIASDKVGAEGQISIDHHISIVP
ncbi:hypothetical protein EJD97_022781 [Solanum chilense]|uniref:Ubiquitin-like domain-containing protein n=1 Tax=Solanum chilense TaxID=4083 RepID=A0A6N2AV76_SOLCI|nr:hypothetical protein EJD97_022781 [Solanum chilense]